MTFPLKPKANFKKGRHPFSSIASETSHLTTAPVTPVKVGWCLLNTH